MREWYRLGGLPNQVQAQAQPDKGPAAPPRCYRCTYASEAKFRICESLVKLKLS